MSTAAILDMLEGVVEAPGGWKALCPIHGDENQSLSIKELDSGATLINCFGCDNKGPAFVEALGLDASELYAPDGVKTSATVRRPAPAKAAKRTRKPLGPIVAEYDYFDEDGVWLYQATRHEPKDFRQRTNDASGKWTWSMDGVRRVLYRLPEVLGAVERGDTIHVVEGEKDVATMEGLGFVATCNVAGAMKWRDEYSEVLRDVDVVILPDVDPLERKNKKGVMVPFARGQLHGADIAKSLDGLAASVRVVELPVKDVSDWVEDMGGDRDGLLRLIEADAVSGQAYVAKMAAWEASVKKAPAVKQAAQEVLPDVQVPTFTNTDQTDIGASDRLVERYGHELRYCAELKRWFVWNGAVWAEDRVGAATARAKAVARENTMSQLARGEKEWKKGLALEGASKIRGALELAAVDEAVAVRADVFDRFRDVLAVPNGTIDLRTGALLSPDPTLMLTQMAPTVYDPDAKALVFDAFIESTMMGRPELIEFMQRWLGYCITGQTREQSLVVAVGEGANGKGTLFDKVGDTIGPLSAEAPQGLLIAKRNDTHPAELMTVRGRRFVTASEVPDGSTFDEARLKWLTGQDTITARGMRQDFVSWAPTHKLTVYLNNKPKVRDTSEGFWRRMMIVPFDGLFGPGREGHDPLLRDKLALEHEGILAWLVRGAVTWYDSGLTRPDAVTRCTSEYREEEDRFGAWLKEYFMDSTAGDEQQASSMFKSYSGWCDRNSERPISLRAFGASLTRSGFSKTRKRDGTHYRRPSVAVAEVAADNIPTLCAHTSARNPEVLQHVQHCNTDQKAGPETAPIQAQKQPSLDDIDPDDLPF
jgi:putative DNA primase/helicase